MTIVSFNFTKIEAEKKESKKGKISINNNVTIEKLEEKDLSLGNQKQKVLNFTFQFTSKYDPDAGHINLTGNVLYMEDSKKVEEILDGWKKDKKLPAELLPVTLNTVLNKCNIQALIISEQVNLPPTVRLPRLGPVEKKA